MFSPPVPVGSLAPGKQVCVAEVVRPADLGVVAARFEDCRIVLEARRWAKIDEGRACHQSFTQMVDRRIAARRQRSKCFQRKRPR